VNLEELLEQVVSAGLERTVEDTVPLSGGRVRCGGDELVDFCSNDYLGLALDPAMEEALSRAAQTLGVGARAARLLSGSRPQASCLEQRFARMTGKPAALLFNSGYHANVGIPRALTNADSLIFSDSANHASIIDGCRLSDAAVEVYRHADLHDLEARLVSARDRGRLRDDCVNLLVTEGIFSMDGDGPDFGHLVELKQRFGLLLLVDEAHGFGTVGKRGLGACEPVLDSVDVYLATFGKAAGVFGAAAASSDTAIRLLRSRARPFIFSTALPPALVAALDVALDVIEGPQGETLRRRLADNVVLFADRLRQGGLQVPTSTSHIVPVPIGPEDMALKAAAILRREGFYCRAIRYPTVPLGRAVLRFSICASHRHDDLVRAAEGVARVCQQLIRGNDGPTSTD